MNSRSWLVAAMAAPMIACAPIDDAPIETSPTIDTHEAELRGGWRLWRQAALGKRVFERRTFDGNGRTCATCHLPDSGSITPEDVQAAWADDPDGPLFRAIDSDDGTGASYDRLRTHATFLIEIPLPDNVTLVDDPEARSVLLPRGASGTLNNPGIETLFLQDGRAASLQEQALGAVNAHAEPGRQPTERELDAVATHQQIRPSFYTNRRLWRWANGIGRAPELPPGRTESEQRGRLFFEPGVDGLCTHCHGGPGLNEVNEFIFVPVPAGARFLSVAVSEFNTIGNPTHRFAFADPDNPNADPVIIESPDPGRALITGRVEDANAFRIPTLWGVAETAPYFHDNSAKTLEELMDHYVAYFAGPPANILLSEQDVADIIAYMRLL